METDSQRLRRAFTEAARNVIDLADEVEESQWTAPALDGWTVRELFVHASRAGSTVTAYAAGTADRELRSPADYYLTALDSDGIHESVAERARNQATELDEPVPAYLRRVFTEAEQTLQRTPSHQVLGTQAGGIALEDYLPTRVVELVVHGIDLAAALGLEARIPAIAMEVALESLAELAVRRPEELDPVDLVNALTGRGSLPEGTNLLG